MAREAVDSARRRIRERYGPRACGYKAIDDLMGRSGTEWAKKLLKKNADKWSFNEASGLFEAIEKFELERTIQNLCSQNSGISRDELKRKYNDQKRSAEIAASRITGEEWDGVPITVGGAIPAEFDDFVRANADQQTLKIIDDARTRLIFRQVISQANSAEYAAAMLYEPESAAAIASTIARYLVDENLIYGDRRTQYDRAFQKLLALFALEPSYDESGNLASHSFRDRCRFTFWSHFRRWDPATVEDIERRIEALKEGMG